MNQYYEHIKEIDIVIELLKSRVSMLEKNRKAVARMKMVVKRSHWLEEAVSFFDCWGFPIIYVHN